MWAARKPGSGVWAGSARIMLVILDRETKFQGVCMSISEGKLRHLKALSDTRGVIAAAAMDQRGSLQKTIAKEKGIDQKAVTHEMLSEFKVAVSKVLTPHASAILLDPEYGLDAAKARSKNAGLLLAYEHSGYDN